MVSSAIWISTGTLLATEWRAHLPDRNWDNAAAHSYSSRVLLTDWGSKDWMPSAIGSWLWPIPDTIIFLFSQIVNPLIGNFVLTLILCSASLVIMIQIGRTIWKSQKITNLFFQIAIALSLLAPFWIGEIGTTFQSWLSAPLILLSLHTLLNGLSNGLSKSKLLFIGVLLGLGTAFKLTNYIFVLATFVCIVAYGISVRHKLREHVSQLSLVSLGLLVGILPILPWWMHAFRSTGNPVFPFYNKYFASDHYPKENFIDTRWSWRFPDSIMNIPTGWASGTPVSELGAFDVRLVILFALYMSVLFAFSINRIVKNQITEIVKPDRLITPSSMMSRVSPATLFHLWIISSTIFWMFLFGYARYWIVVELLIGVAIADLLLRVFHSRNSRVVSIVLVFLLTTAVISPVNWNVSATPNLGTIEKPWDSPLTRAAEELSGVMITQGSPTSFIRQTNPNLTNLIGIDFPNIPHKYKEIIDVQLKSQNSVSFLTTRPYANPEELKKVLNDTVGVRLKLVVSCQNYIGPILIDYQLCKIRKS